MRKKLPELCDIQYGYAFDSAGFTADSSYPPLVRIRDVKRGYSETYYEGDYPEEYILHAGDLLVGMDGEFNISRWKSRDALLNQRVCKVTAKEGTNEEYLRFALSKALKEIESRTAFVTVKHLSSKELNKLELCVPTILEQNIIADTLSRVEQIISLRSMEIQKFDDLVKARFVEMFGDCTTEVLIGDVITICRGASPRPIQAFITEAVDGVNWIKIGDVSENSLYITQTAEKITQEGAKKSRAVHKGDFILSNSMSFGRPYILAIDGCVHDGWLILSDFRDTFDELYLYHALRSEHVQHQFSGKVNGATVKNLNSDLVKTTYIQVPDINEQKSFADFCKQVDKSKVVKQKVWMKYKPR